jgi:hypothetical protein
MDNAGISLSLVRNKNSPPDGSKSVPKPSYRPLTEEQARRLSIAPPADFMSDQPCPICGLRERWHWLDGRELCRTCLILDLVPMTVAIGKERTRAPQ